MNYVQSCTALNTIWLSVLSSGVPGQAEVPWDRDRGFWSHVWCIHGTLHRRESWQGCREGLNLNELLVCWAEFYWLYYTTPEIFIIVIILMYQCSCQVLSIHHALCYMLSQFQSLRNPPPPPHPAISSNSKLVPKPLLCMVLFACTGYYWFSFLTPINGTM